MRKPPEAFARLGRALGGAVKDGGGPARWCFAGRCVPATGVHYGARDKAQKHQGGGPKLTKRTGWSESQRSDVGSEVVRRRWAELRGPGCGMLLRWQETEINFSFSTGFFNGNGNKKFHG